MSPTRHYGSIQLKTSRKEMWKQDRYLKKWHLVNPQYFTWLFARSQHAFRMSHSGLLIFPQSPMVLLRFAIVCYIFQNHIATVSPGCCHGLSSRSAVGKIKEDAHIISAFAILKLRSCATTTAPKLDRANENDFYCDSPLRIVPTLELEFGLSWS